MVELFFGVGIHYFQQIVQPTAFRMSLVIIAVCDHFYTGYQGARQILADIFGPLIDPRRVCFYTSPFIGLDIQGVSCRAKRWVSGMVAAVRIGQRRTRIKDIIPAGFI